MLNGVSRKHRKAQLDGHDFVTETERKTLSHGHDFVSVTFCFEWADGHEKESRGRSPLVGKAESFGAPLCVLAHIGTGYYHGDSD